MTSKCLSPNEITREILIGLLGAVPGCRAASDEEKSGDQAPVIRQTASIPFCSMDLAKKSPEAFYADVMKSGVEELASLINRQIPVGFQAVFHHHPDPPKIPDGYGGQQEQYNWMYRYKDMQRGEILAWDRYDMVLDMMTIVVQVAFVPQMAAQAVAA